VVEASCKKHPSPFQRTCQFWNPAGKEALLGLETFWRNERPPVLFPHSRPALCGLRSEMRRCVSRQGLIFRQLVPEAVIVFWAGCIEAPVARQFPPFYIRGWNFYGVVAGLDCS